MTWEMEVNAILRPEPIPAFGFVPFGGWLKESAALDQMFLDHVEIDFKAQTGGMGHCNVAVLDDGATAPGNGDKVAPEGFFGEVVFEGDEVFGGSGTMHTRHGADGRTGHVHRHANPPLSGVIADALGFHDATTRGHVRVNDIDATGIDERFKAIEGVDIFTGTDGRVEFTLELYPLIGELPRHQVFEPRQIVGLERFTKANTIVDADMTKVVSGNWHFVAYRLTHLGHIFHNHVQPFGGDTDVREGVLQGVQVEHFVEVLVAPAGQHAIGIGQRTGDADEGLDAYVHFEHGIAPRDALLELFAHRHTIGFVGGIAVHAHAVAVLTTGEGKGGYAIGFAGQVHQGHFDTGHAATLATVMAELLDFAEQTIDVAGIFAQQAAFEHQSVFGGGQVTDFAPTANPLVGIDADDAKVPVVPAHRGNPHIGDFEVARV